MIVQGQTTSFKKELYLGVHDLDTDTIKIALYTGFADLNLDTTVYTTTNEITGTGYTAGGKILTGTSVNSANDTAYVSFNNATWDPAVFTCRCALIYNVTKGNKSIAVLDFGSNKTATGTFTITFPADTSTAAVIRMK
mgnify:FL=1